MKTSINFKDFKPEELIGKYVLYESGRSFDTNLNRSISKITKVLKTGFKISKCEEVIFDFNGHQKGLSGRANMAIISTCYLLTQEEASKIFLEWKEKREIKGLKFEITSKLDSLTFEQLKAINLIINN